MTECMNGNVGGESGFVSHSRVPGEYKMSVTPRDTGWAEKGAVEKLVCFSLSEPEFISDLMAGCECCLKQTSMIRP